MHMYSFHIHMVHMARFDSTELYPLREKILIFYFFILQYM